MPTAELDAMVRDIRAPKLLDWFIVHVVKPGRHAEELRLRWKESDGLVGRAGWSLTTARVVKNADGLRPRGATRPDREGDEAGTRAEAMGDESLSCEIGIHHASLRKRAIKIGERLAVHVDYPASPGCTPPYAPLWIAEMVRRCGD